ncbi:MAG: arylsulfatase [Deltaproteobacteria bacterium]|nr:arylsulfatase [Deltaproteobacteria bacterium]
MQTCRIAAGAALALTLASAAWAQSAPKRTVLPPPEPPFRGKLATLSTDSKPDYPQWVKAPAGAPNILLVLLDDTGFGQPSTFGGPIATPNFSRIAQTGLRYNQFHTAGVCSPTRAALLTGRNAHSAGTGTITELGEGYPGYTTILPRSTATIAEILRQNGYNTAMFGKWHNTPDHETSPAGPFDHWPTGVGFEYFYGFLGGDTNQWNPALYENTLPVQKPAGKSDYHFTTDIADRAISWMRTQKSVAGDKPFFVYWAPGATHAPHHAPREWIDKFKGQFDQGWDKVREETLARQIQMGVVPPGTKLTPRPQNIKAWDSLSADEKRLFAHMQEVFAGFLAHTDHEFGRLLDAIEQIGVADNTLVIVSIGDNGPSSEGRFQGSLNETAILNHLPEGDEFQRALARIDQLGGPYTNNHYPVGWAVAGATPFKWVKAVASHFGGTRNPLIVSWPRRIRDKGGLRSQFHHCADIAPTILEVTSIAEPTEVNGTKQKPMEGVSMAYTFDNAQAPTRKETQYFETFGNRGVYHKGWMASAFRIAGYDPTFGFLNPLDAKWELYKLDEDFSQANDLASQYPQKAKELADLWMREAKKYNVLPLTVVNSFATSNRPSYTRGRTSFTYYPGTVRITEGSAPTIVNRSHTITADVVIPESGAEGILVTEGGRFGGYAFYVRQGKLHYAYNFIDRERYVVASSQPVPSGKVSLTMHYACDGGQPGGGGTVTLLANGNEIGHGRLEKTIPFRLSLDETFDVGEDTGTPVVEDYQVPFRFNGQLDKVTIVLEDERKS